MSDDTCRYCHRTLIEIDHYGEWLIGLACRDQEVNFVGLSI